MGHAGTWIRASQVPKCSSMAAPGSFTWSRHASPVPPSCVRRRVTCRRKGTQHSARLATAVGHRSGRGCTQPAAAELQCVDTGQTQDGFEQQLQNFASSSRNGKEETAARAAVFLKGKIRGDYLLTLGYDSDKDTRERLFRDIQPDRFYPVYGDSSVKGFDAQSTSRLYVRLDKGRSWLLYGDITTQSTSDVRQLSNYTRSLTGIKEHYETSRMVINAFASKDSTTQVIDELPANGTSGPFTLSTENMVENSERVELLVRDRNQPSLIIQTTPLQRFSDYEIEPLTGTPVAEGPHPQPGSELQSAVHPRHPTR